MKPADLPDVLRRLYRLLKPEGVLYASFKYGSGEREKDGRFFYDMTESDCQNLLEETGFAVKELFVTGDVRAGREKEDWVNAIAKKE